MQNGVLEDFPSRTTHRVVLCCVVHTAVELVIWRAKM